ncbi:hypothetical protein [Streptomyces sp. NPDC054975]
MDITTRLQLLEALRRAEQADAAYAAASRACARVTQTAVDAFTGIGRCEQQLAATPRPIARVERVQVQVCAPLPAPSVPGMSRGSPSP